MEVQTSFISVKQFSPAVSGLFCMERRQLCITAAGSATSDSLWHVMPCSAVKTHPAVQGIPFFWSAKPDSWSNFWFSSCSTVDEAHLSKSIRLARRRPSINMMNIGATADQMHVAQGADRLSKVSAKIPVTEVPGSNSARSSVGFSRWRTILRFLGRYRSGGFFSGVFLPRVLSTN